jgi:hypothetical protein
MVGVCIAPVIAQEIATLPVFFAIEASNHLT